MERVRGQKGKHGETDREIIFALCYNMLMGYKDGLSVYELAKTVENATGKDRDGLRKRIAYLKREESILHGILIKIPHSGSKTTLKIEISSLLDLARFYVFMEKLPEEGYEELYCNFIPHYLDKYITEVVDILQLWKPGDPNYGLPMDTCRKFEKENTVIFDPKLYPETGPSHLKAIAKIFQIFNSDGYVSIEKYFGSQKEQARFFHLLLEFTDWASKEGKKDEKLRLIPQVELDEKFSVVNTTFPIPMSLLPIDIQDEKNEKLELEYRWFLDIWKEVWGRAGSGELLLHTYDHPRDICIPIKDRTPANIALALGIPLKYVEYDKSRDNMYISYKLPDKLMPEIEDSYYPQILFRNGKYILHKMDWPNDNKELEKANENISDMDDLDKKWEYKEY
jgi:hypothetical protein